MYVEKKWQSNAKKVAFAKSFPGRLVDWRSATGKTIEKIVSVDGRRVHVVVFSDGTFVLTLPPDVEPADMIPALLAARPFLEPFHREGFEELDQRIASDKEMQRMARLENLIGAIRNNLPHIPELKEEIRRLLEEQGE